MVVAIELFSSGRGISGCSGDLVICSFYSTPISGFPNWDFNQRAAPLFVISPKGGGRLLLSRKS